MLPLSYVGYNHVGYNSVVKSRPDKTRGRGVALLIKDSYQYAPLTIIDNSLFNTFEFSAISVKLLDSIVNLVNLVKSLVNIYESWKYFYKYYQKRRTLLIYVWTLILTC